MHRIDGDGHVSNTFTEGDPGLGVRATQVTADWLNAVQAEIAAVIEAAGITLSKPDNNQLLDALQAAGLYGGASYDNTAVTITIASGTLVLNFNAARTKRIAFNANITTTTLQNIPAADHMGYFNLVLTADGSARTWAWLTSTVKWPGGIAPTFTTTNGKKDWFFVWTEDGGTTWFGQIVGQNF